MSLFDDKSKQPAKQIITRAFRLGIAGGFCVIIFSFLAGIDCSAADLPPHHWSIAPTPPMGWNSWDCYGPCVREEEVKANADYMAEHLKSHGWQYIVVDIQWYEPNARAQGYNSFAPLEMDSWCRLIPAVNRFPSAANGNGFKPLADYVHSKGLKFGIHIMRGIPRQAVKAKMPVKGTSFTATDIADTNSTCKWITDMYGVNPAKPGAQAYYDSIIQLYTQWGVDYIKCDDMSSPYHKEEVQLLRKALDIYGPNIVLSLSPGPAPVKDAEHLKANANLWRMSGDFWDNWRALKETFGLCQRWMSKGGPGCWPDCDMLPLGRIGIRAERGKDRRTNFTKDEQVTLMTLWSIFKSPLMFGGDMPSCDEWTLSLITNDEVLAVNQHGQNPRQLYRDVNEVVWMSDVPDTKDKYVALFNLNDTQAADVSADFAKMGLTSRCSVKDLWTHKEMGAFVGRFSTKINAHGAGLYRVIPQ
jgi:alpha-galactosidase